MTIRRSNDDTMLQRMKDNDDSFRHIFRCVVALAFSFAVAIVIVVVDDACDAADIIVFVFICAGVCSSLTSRCCCRVVVVILVVSFFVVDGGIVVSVGVSACVTDSLFARSFTRPKLGQCRACHHFITFSRRHVIMSSLHHFFV